MISRKQFLKDLLYRGFRTVNDLTGKDEGCFSQHAGPDHGFDLPSTELSHALTELSPSLLKIEAERLGIDPAHVDEAELRSKIYAALSEQCR